jgi:hypothetical protein
MPRRAPPSRARRVTPNRPPRGSRGAATGPATQKRSMPTPQTGLPARRGTASMPGGMNPQALAAAQAAQKSMIKPQSPAMNPMAQRQDLSSMGPAQNAGMGKPTPPMGMGAMAAMGGMPPPATMPATMGGMAKPMGMKKGGKVGGRGDGVATKGKTKGRMC